MTNGKIFFNPIEGSGPLSISWYSGPKGCAVEASNGIGVGFFSKNGDLLSVLFDDVGEKHDHQTLIFSKFVVELKIINKKITYHVTSGKPVLRHKAA